MLGGMSMNFIINTENICEENIVDKKEKVRALILTDDNKILVANYFGILLLPGGKVDKGESLEVALIRELNED